MEAGLQIYNTTGNVQIDSKFKNLAVIQKGEVQLLGTDVEWTSGAKTKITVAGTNPLIAIQSTVRMRTRRLREANGSYSFYFNMSQNVSPPKVKYWIFDEPVSVGNFGLQVFDQASQLVFDSSREYMKVIGFVNWNATFPYFGTSQTYNYTSSSLAIVTCQQASKLEDSGGGQNPETMIYSVTGSVNSSVLTVFDGLEWFVGGIIVSPYTRTQATLLILDVTGM